MPSVFSLCIVRLISLWAPVLVLDFSFAALMITEGGKDLMNLLGVAPEEAVDPKHLACNPIRISPGQIEIQQDRPDLQHHRFF